MQIPTGLKRSASMIVLRNEQKFLLLKRAKPPHQGKYLPVGGKLDPFEDPYSAAKRELEEETGLKIDVLHFCGVLTESSPTKYNWQSYIYVADIDFITPPFCNEGELEWIEFKDIPLVPTPETDWHVYDYIMRRQHFVFNAVYDNDLNLLFMKDEIENKLVVGC
ncbi:MAG: NUDIX domain-containing protein [Bacteroidota bacterium]